MGQVVSRQASRTHVSAKNFRQHGGYPSRLPMPSWSDASHAWCSLWTPDEGWVDFDPTNGHLPVNDHVTIGWGRDYGDVSPINGFIVGGGSHQVSVAVDVHPAVQ